MSQTMTQSNDSSRDEPIRIDWRGDARNKVFSAILAKYESGEKVPKEAVDAFQRAETRVVIHSDRAAKEILHELEYILEAPGSYVWMDGNKRAAIQRVANELRGAINGE